MATYVCFTCASEDGSPMIVSDTGYERHVNHEIAPPGNFLQCNKCGYYCDSAFVEKPCMEEGCFGILKHL